MNKRIMKKAEKRRRRDIHQILDMVLDINGLTERKRDKTGDLPTAFFEFLGHVAGINVSINEHGWHDEANEEKKFNAYTDSLDDVKVMKYEMEKYIHGHSRSKKK